MGFRKKEKRRTPWTFPTSTTASRVATASLGAFGRTADASTWMPVDGSNPSLSAASDASGDNDSRTSKCLGRQGLLDPQHPGRRRARRDGAHGPRPEAQSRRAHPRRAHGGQQHAGVRDVGQHRQHRGLGRLRCGAGRGRPVACTWLFGCSWSSARRSAPLRWRGPATKKTLPPDTATARRALTHLLWDRLRCRRKARRSSLSLSPLPSSRPPVDGNGATAPHQLAATSGALPSGVRGGSQWHGPPPGMSPSFNQPVPAMSQHAHVRAIKRESLC